MGMVYIDTGRIGVNRSEPKCLPELGEKAEGSQEGKF